MTTTITIKDKAINATYQDRTGATSGTGTGAKFDVTKTNGVYTVTVDTAGTGYAAGDTITLLGTGLGGTSANNLILTVATVGTGGAIATFGKVGTGRVGDGVVDVVVDVTGTDSVDTYTFVGNSEDFTVSYDFDSGEATVVSDLATNVSFNLADHERVVFDDKAIAFDTTGVAGDIYSLLGAGLGVADISEEYLGAGIYLKEQGLTNVQIAQALLGTDVYKQDAGGVSNETFIKHVYNNVYGQQATLSQVTELVAYMETNKISQAEILVAAANLEDFQDTIDLVGMVNGIDYIPYQG
jgi:hypothetical protein